MTIPAKEKKTKGRQKIAIEKINKKSALQVTFTKRRTGLFQKASELCILCGAEIAIITFSPGNKVYTFGNPSTDYIVNMFQNANMMNPDECDWIRNEAYLSTCAKKEEYYNAVKKFEMEKDRVHDGGDQQGGFWWDAPAEGMDLEELEVFKDSLHELRSNVCGRITELMNLQSRQGNNTNTTNNNTMINVMPHPAVSVPDPDVHLPSSSKRVDDYDDDSSQMLMRQYNFNGIMSQYHH